MSISTKAGSFDENCGKRDSAAILSELALIKSEISQASAKVHNLHAAQPDRHAFLKSRLPKLNVGDRLDEMLDSIHSVADYCGSSFSKLSGLLDKRLLSISHTNHRKPLD